MTEFQTFAAICKGYCAINVLVLPKQFENGGWLIGLLSINLGCMFVLFCALKLVDCAQKLELRSYQEIAKVAFGPQGEKSIAFIIACCQFSFTVA